MVIFFYFIMMQNSITAEENSVFGNINVYPLEPTPLSVVNFTVGINNNITVDDVRLIVRECTGDMCFAKDLNVSMNYSYTCCMDFYETQIKLVHKDVTQLKYYVKIFNNDTWYISNASILNLSVPGNNNPLIISENKSTPGFEMPLLVLSIVLIIVFNQWKRKSGRKL